ncbi:MAG: nucleotide-diphospho-sugar transferase [Verrucomicrobiota bacterium]
MEVVSLQSDAPVDAPVLFLTFNRPEQTAKVWEAIRCVKPRRLWISQDGPREDRPEDADACRAVREILEEVDWPCEVRRLYREENLGCGKAVSEALGWFLEEAGEGIILEDDIVPSPVFFRYCEALLERFRDDKSIGSIGGYSALPLKLQKALSRGEEGRPLINLYRGNGFSPWGWATWRDRLEGYALEPSQSRLEAWEEMVEARSGFPLRDFLTKRILKALRDGAADTWDYQLSFHFEENERFMISPMNNLVQNIGFGEGATHTKESSGSAGLMIHEIDQIGLPESIPPEPEIDQIAYAIGALNRSELESVTEEIRMLRETCEDRLERIARLSKKLAKSGRSRPRSKLRKFLDRTRKRLLRVLARVSDRSR